MALGEDVMCHMVPLPHTLKSILRLPCDAPPCRCTHTPTRLWVAGLWVSFKAPR